jgi:hypothetical protein
MELLTISSGSTSSESIADANGWMSSGLHKVSKKPLGYYGKLNINTPFLDVYAEHG